MSDNAEAVRAKLGAGSLQAALRQGLHEVRNALYPDSNVAAPTEAGMYGTALPSEVAEQRHGDSKDAVTSSPSYLTNRLREADRHVEAPSNNRDGPELERE